MIKVFATGNVGRRDAQEPTPATSPDGEDFLSTAGVRSDVRCGIIRSRRAES